MLYPDPELEVSDYMEHFRLTNDLNPNFDIERSIETGTEISREDKDTLILQCRLEGLIK